ncbi:Aminopeptidase pepS, partial [Dysosmobacter welbionis]
GRHRQLPALGRRSAGGGESRQRIPPQGIDGTGGEGQPLIYQGDHGVAAVGGAAGLAEAGFQLQSIQGPGPGGLRHRAGDRDAVAVPVRHSQGAGHPRGNGAGEIHRHCPQAVPFIGPAGLLKEVLGVRSVLRTGAEHGSAVFALPVPVGEAGPGEGLLQLRPLVGGGTTALLQQAGVDAGDDGHILRPLHAALQLHAGYAHGPHLLQPSGQTAVLQAQGICLFGGGVNPVGQAAGLGAAAPVAGATPDQGAHLALAGVAHAQRPVGKDLHFHRAVFTDRTGVLRRTLPGNDHPLAAVGGDLPGTAGGEQAHLGAGVEGQIRQRPAQQAEQPPVLHQHRVHPQAAGLNGCLQRLGQLPVRHQGVQRQKDPDPPLVAV